jgi:hypothetical protein
MLVYLLEDSPRQFYLTVLLNTFDNGCLQLYLKKISEFSVASIIVASTLLERARYVSCVCAIII